MAKRDRQRQINYSDCLTGEELEADIDERVDEAVRYCNL